MNTRWVVVDQHGRKMVAHGTRWRSRAWLRDVRESNPNTVEGWTVERWVISKLGATVRASTDMCPSRTTWRLDEDGWWRCLCCTDVNAYRSLVQPLPVRALT